MREIKVQTSHIKQKKQVIPKYETEIEIFLITDTFVDGNYGYEILSITPQKCQNACDSKM